MKPLAFASAALPAIHPHRAGPMRTITLEEHFISPGFLAGPGKDFTERLRGSGPRGAKICDQLQDIGDKRVAEMDAAKIDMQVLSLNSAVPSDGFRRST
jgi:hypothetical protein